MPTEKINLPLKKPLRQIKDRNNNNFIIEICLSPPAALSCETNTPQHSHSDSSLKELSRPPGLIRAP
jgi:hypothetical protein